MSIHFIFFPILFHRFFCFSFWCLFADPVGCCYWSFFALFNVILDFLQWCIYGVNIADEYSSFFFFYKYTISISPLNSKILCIVIHFKVTWSICLSSVFVHLDNRPRYHTRETTLVYISLMWFLQQSQSQSVIDGRDFF